MQWKCPFWTWSKLQQPTQTCSASFPLPIPLCTGSHILIPSLPARVTSAPLAQSMRLSLKGHYYWCKLSKSIFSKAPKQIKDPRLHKELIRVAWYIVKNKERCKDFCLFSSNFSLHLQEPLTYCIVSMKSWVTAPSPHFLYLVAVLFHTCQFMFKWIRSSSSWSDSL